MRRPPVTMISEPSSQNLLSSEPAAWMPSKGWREVLPATHQDTKHRQLTCYDNLGRSKTHGLAQRYISPTTGVCRRLVIQAVNPKGPNECPITDHTGRVSQVALWLYSTNPFHHPIFLEWIGTWFLFTFMLLWNLILRFTWLLVRLCILVFLQTDLTDDPWEDSELFNTGYYKPYVREFNGQLWAARSKKEYSTHVKYKGDEDEDDEEEEEGGGEKGEEDIPTHSLYPRLLMIHDPTRDEWYPCTEPSTIMSNKYIAISYRAADVYISGPDEKTEKELFIQEVRLAAVQQNFDAYWLDLECIGETPDEKNRDVYCMADVYRGAESTLIMLGNSGDDEKDAWKRWGGRVWKLPEALLSQRLLYKFRGRSEIDSVSLHQLANLAYPEHNLEQAVINAYSGKDPLERLERLSLLKSAIWRRGVNVPSTPSPFPLESAPSPPSVGNSTTQRIPPRSGPHAAERVYVLMGFFGHRIRPDYAEDELRALARLSMANDNDRIAERMVSLLPSTPRPNACWYADNDIYGANLWDILPEIQVAGVTENGALVLDGCRAASIRWRNFPEISFGKSGSVVRTVVGIIPYCAWPILLVGILLVALKNNTVLLWVGIALLVIGAVLLVVSPKLYVISEAGRVVTAQPWLIGVKGILDVDSVAAHLYGGGNKGHYPRLRFTPSGSEFAIPDHGRRRMGSKAQYDKAKKAEAEGARMYTLIDTHASSVYYFRAARPPTVCLFTGREGGLGRFVLCSERCHVGELHKETVLRMPTEVSQSMLMCGWVALG